MTERSAPPAPISAGIVVLVRPPTAERKPFEVLLARRHPRSEFLPRTDVFPGGKLGPGETAPLAAARELLEEAGVLLVPGATLEIAAAVRAALKTSRASFEMLLEEHGLAFDPCLLRPWAHWITPSAEPLRFSARFFLACVPEGQVATCDQEEMIGLEWTTPLGALSAFETGAMRLPPPTLHTLEELARFDGVDALLSECSRRVVVPILPKLVERGRGLVLLLPWDSLYQDAEGEGAPVPIDHPLRRGPSRIELPEGRWWSRG